MEAKSQIIDAHGSIDDTKYMVVPMNVRIALVGTVGTLMGDYGTGEIDYSAEEFMTWYYGGDIMPRISLDVMSWTVDGTPVDFGPAEYVRNDPDSGRMMFLEDAVEDYEGTVYVYCCLAKSPPEFTPVKNGYYLSRYHDPAPANIPGLEVDAGDRLLQANLYIGMGKFYPTPNFLLHPSLTPDLFDRIIGERERVATPEASVIWAEHDRFWVLQGNSDAFVDQLNEALFANFIIEETEIALTPDRIQDGLDSGLAAGILCLPTLVKDYSESDISGGVFMVSNVSENERIGFPVWDAWKIEPARGGGLEIPDAAELIRNGKAYIGDIRDIRD